MLLACTLTRGLGYSAESSPCRRSASLSSRLPPPGGCPVWHFKGSWRQSLDSINIDVVAHAIHVKMRSSSFFLNESVGGTSNLTRNCSETKLPPNLVTGIFVTVQLVATLTVNESVMHGSDRGGAGADVNDKRVRLARSKSTRRSVCILCLRNGLTYAARTPVLPSQKAGAPQSSRAISMHFARNITVDVPSFVSFLFVVIKAVFGSGRSVPILNDAV
ncbi:hypothetical protein KCU98_g117, partial [Aureobasidium melanogenum]